MSGMRFMLEHNAYRAEAWGCWGEDWGIQMKLRALDRRNLLSKSALDIISAIQPQRASGREAFECMNYSGPP